MTQELNQSIVSLFTNNKLLGVGFLADKKHILTCTHVLITGQESYEVQFPLIDGSGSYTAHVVLSHSVEEGDISVLELEGKLDTKAYPVVFSKQKELWGHPFKAFGYPAKQDAGIWTEGKLLDRQNSGWVQLQGRDEIGYFAQPGFSGGPAYDLQLEAVVGMIVASDSNSDLRVAYIIPTNKLLAAWPALQIKLNVATQYESELPAPGLLRYLLDLLLPRFHRFLTQIGVFPKPPHWDVLDEYLGKFCDKMQDSNKSYIPLEARYGPKSRPIIYQSQETKHVRNTIRSIIDLSHGGDLATARITEISRRSRIVRNITQKLIHAKEPLVLLGDPGTGKSMTLREAGKRIAQKEKRKVFSKVVIYLRLGEFRVSGKVDSDEVMQFIKESLPSNIRPLLRALINSQRLIIFFDGMDEMSRQNYNNQVDALSHFAGENNDRIRTLFSCRINDFSPKFTHQQLVLARLTYTQVLQYIRLNLKSSLPINVGSEFLQAKQLARRLIEGNFSLDPTNPQALFLFCTYLLYRKSWPNTRSSLLEVYFEMRLGQLNILKEDAFPIWAKLAYQITRQNRGSLIPYNEAIQKLTKSQPEEKVLLCLENGIKSGILVLDDSK